MPTFFSVHLDADEPLVHQRGDGGIGIDRPLGFMAPVARAVADGEEDRLVLFLAFPMASPPHGYLCLPKTLDSQQKRESDHDRN